MRSESSFIHQFGRVGGPDRSSTFSFPSTPCSFAVQMLWSPGAMRAGKHAACLCKKPSRPTGPTCPERTSRTREEAGRVVASRASEGAVQQPAASSPDIPFVAPIPDDLGHNGRAEGTSKRAQWVCGPLRTWILFFVLCALPEKSSLAHPGHRSPHRNRGARKLNREEEGHLERGTCPYTGR